MRYLFRKRPDSFYPCECCGFLTLTDPEPGSYEICPVCFWECDPVQNGDPLFLGGANSVCLNEARENYVRLGACAPELTHEVRMPYIEEVPPAPRITGLDAANRTSAISAVKRLVVGICRSIVTGDIKTLEGCCALSGVAYELYTLDDPELDRCLGLLEGVAGEVDEFPLGDVRGAWAPEALAIKDREAVDYEGRVRTDVHAACRQVQELLQRIL